MFVIAEAINQAAVANDIPSTILAAVVLQESGGDPLAIRYEPRFFQTYLVGATRHTLAGFVPNPNQCSFQTELRARAFSWGLMQLMGQTAREQGFDGVFLSGLLDISTNLSIGAKYLAKKVKHKDGNMEAALLAYNGGGNPIYPQEVMAHIDTGAVSLLLGSGL